MVLIFNWFLIFNFITMLQQDRNWVEEDCITKCEITYIYYGFAFKVIEIILYKACHSKSYTNSYSININWIFEIRSIILFDLDFDTFPISKGIGAPRGPCAGRSACWRRGRHWPRCVALDCARLARKDGLLFVHLHYLHGGKIHESYKWSTHIR